MTLPYRLHYAPDNASLIIRLAMEEMDVSYDTVLVNRAARAQKSPEYLALNPNGLIPVLETPQGPVFETGAILLWLSDMHGKLGPAPRSPDRAAYLKWLFFVSNTVHSELRMMFYPHLYVGSSDAVGLMLRETLQKRLKVHLSALDLLAKDEPNWLNAEQPTGLVYYIACLMRWMGLYPQQADRSWFDLNNTVNLQRMLAQLEQRTAVKKARMAEGLGENPFTVPDYANPPEGSAT